MGPKKKEMAIDPEEMWRKVIEDAQLNDEGWNVKVILIEAAGTDQDKIYLSKFETYAAQEKRFVVKNICKTETVFMINQLGTEKKVKDDNLRVFEEGNAYLKEKKNIPPDVYALIIKHLILKMKEEYLFIKSQRLEVQDGMRRESATMVEKVEVKGIVSALYTPVTDGQEKDPRSFDGKKFNTSLRVRGEEWRDKVYVDDYPTDGPNLYVAITGFSEPFLPGCLVRIGIPLTSIVQIRIDATNQEIPPSLSRVTKRVPSQTEILGDFWNTLQLLRIQEDSADDFKDTAFIVFTPPYWASDKLSGEPDRIYDELCSLMYDIQDLSRQHVHYLENMEIINIPESKNREDYKAYYHRLIDDMPLECVTIYSVLDSILNTICKNLKDTSKSSLSTAATINKVSSPVNKQTKSENLVKDIFSTLCKAELNKKKYRITYGDEYENHKDPIIIKYGDIAKFKTFELGNINLKQIVISSLLGMPVHNLWFKQIRPSAELESKVNFHVNVLLSCFDREELEPLELNRLLHILACRKLYNNRSSLKKQHVPPTTITEFKKVYLKRSILAEPLPTCPSIKTSSRKFPSFTKTVESVVSYTGEGDTEVQRIKYLFDCPDISELVSASEIANNHPKTHMIDDFEFFEDFSDECAFQIMYHAFNKYNCVDYKHCEVTDCFILMFFNSHDADGIARDEWRCHLSTPVCLQDFFDYILEEHYDWIQKEEKLYDENVLLKAKSVSKDEIDQSILVSCIEDTDVDTDLLMEGSLKHQVLQAGEANLDRTDSVDPFLAPQPFNSPTTIIPDKISRKPKSPASLSTKTVKQLSHGKTTDSLASIEIPPKPFQGYNLGDRRVEVFGKDATYFSKDGTKISSLYNLIIPMNLEYIHLRIIPGNDQNEFSIHKALGEFVSPEIRDSCESFRITSKDNVMINIKKQIYMAPLASTNPSLTDTAEKRNQAKSLTTDKVSAVHLVSQTLLNKHFHSLSLTWPNGMITETVHENNSSKISHIKQFHVCPKPDLEENIRCISLNGEVVVFKNSGNIEVLKPDGCYIDIKKCHKRLVVPVGLEEENEDTSIKLKKSKTKTKSSKTTSKSSKTVTLEDEKISDDKNLEYELIIDEFSTIECDGFRNEYVGDILVNTKRLLIRTATDYCIGEIFSRRMDGTTILLNMDGLFIVTFPNKTRIITKYVIDENEVYPEWTDEEKEYFELFDPEIESVNSKYSVSQKSFNKSNSAVLNNMEEEETGEKERTDGYIFIHLIYSVEHLNFSTVTIDKASGNISIESPNETTVVINNNNNYNIILDNVTTADFDGENLKISYEACPECRAFTTCNVKILQSEGSLSSVDNSWVKMKDSFCKNVIVNDEGNITIDQVCSSTDILHSVEVMQNSTILSDQICSMTSQDQGQQNCEYEIEDEVKIASNVDGSVIDTESRVPSHGKCRNTYLAKAMRFFILRRDLSCSELVHRTHVEKYKSECRWQPWCSINEYDTFGDHRRFISIITPVQLTESEKWYMNSKLADKPKYLTFKDLVPDNGKGFYQWMRPYKRFQPKPIKPETVFPPRLPRAYVLRNLELQWVEAEREQLKGAKELLEAILRYRKVMEADSENLLNNPILDPRSEEEQRIDDLIQNLAHSVGSEYLQRAAQRCVSQEVFSYWRTACEASRFAVSSCYRRLMHKRYQELSNQLMDHVQRSAKATITTKPPPSPSIDEYIEVEQFGEESSSKSSVDEDQDGLVKQLSQLEELSPKLQQYWRRRAEELKEEEFYKYLLREGSVPPYFRNILGGAIWWEMNHTAGEAVTKAERRKTKCICSENIVDSDESMAQHDGYILPGPFHGSM